LPIDNDISKSTLLQQLANFRETPETPVISKGVSQVRSISKFKMDSINHIMRNRIDFALIPHVFASTADSALGAYRLVRLPAAVQIQHKYAVFHSRPPHAGKIFPQLSALFENPVTQLRCVDKIKFFACGPPHILLKKRNPLCGLTQ